VSDPVSRKPSGTAAGSGLRSHYDDPVATSPVRPVVLRNGVHIEDPLGVVLDFLRAYPRLGISDPAEPAVFGEPDLRLANRGGARISAAEIAAILERRGAIEGALRAIAPDVSLAGASDSVPWLVLRQLFDAFADIRGVGFAKMTKALYPKRPALIPMLDSIVQRYLRDDDLGAHAPFAERALEFVHGYKRDLDRNQAAVRAVRAELARSGYALTEVRILDLLILSAETATGGLGRGREHERPAVRQKSFRFLAVSWRRRSAGRAGWRCRSRSIPRRTGRRLADGHRELARSLFADMPAEAFGSFDTGLGYVVNRLRTLLTEPDASAPGPMPRDIGGRKGVVPG
jgi:Family of unknown function (DUF6308)